MISIPWSRFGVDAAGVQARVDAFRQALDDHKRTVGVPAPREDDLIEHLARNDVAFEVEPRPEDDPPPTPLTLEQLRATAGMRIDERAERVRLRYITPGAGQAATYLIKERQAEAFRAAGYTGDVPAMIQAEVDATGSTAQAAADLILAQRDAWIGKAAQIELERRRGKIATEAAADEGELEIALKQALDALEAL